MLQKNTGPLFQIIFIGGTIYIKAMYQNGDLH